MVQGGRAWGPLASSGCHPGRQDTEDFQLLLRLKLMMERRGKSQGSTPFSPGPDFQTQNDTPLALPPTTQPSAFPSWKMTRQYFPCEILWPKSLAPPRIDPQELVSLLFPALFLKTNKQTNRSSGQPSCCACLGLTSISLGCGLHSLVQVIEEPSQANISGRFDNPFSSTGTPARLLPPRDKEIFLKSIKIH